MLNIVISILCSLCSCLVFKVRNIRNKSKEDIIVNTVGYYSLTFVTIFTTLLVENSVCYVPTFAYILAIFEIALFAIFGNAYVAGFLWIDDNDIR